MRTTLGWARVTVEWVVCLLVILYVFAQLQGRLETIIVSILGLIYTTIRFVGIGVESTTIALGGALALLETQIKGIAEPGYQRDRSELDAFDKAVKTHRMKLYFGGMFLVLIDLICLWRLFTTLQGGS
jgi:hypothetical protein